MRRRLLLAAMLGALSACGFELRRPPQLPFSRLALRGFKPGSPLEQELRRQLSSSVNTRMVDELGQADAVLEVHRDQREKVVVASTAAGQVRELQLRVRFRFRLRTPADHVLIPSTELLLSRDMSYNESAALAKEQEEALLFRAMDSDIVAQVLRRLAAVAPPG